MRYLAAVLLLIMSAIGPAFGQSGVAEGVRPDATSGRGSNVQRLVVGADVFIGDTVTTDAAGLVQLLFSDRTELVIGPRSKLVLEDYLIRNNGSAGKFTISALAGTFRFASGSAPKDRYLISTPNGTIGVRGTALDFTVSSQKPAIVSGSGTTTSLVLFNGGVRVCNTSGSCMNIDDECNFGAMNGAGAVEFENDAESRAGFRPLFPLANNQGVLLAPFRVSNARECLNQPPPPGGVVPQPSEPETRDEHDDSDRSGSSTNYN